VKPAFLAPSALLEPATPEGGDDEGARGSALAARAALGTGDSSRKDRVDVLEWRQAQDAEPLDHEIFCKSPGQRSGATSCLPRSPQLTQVLELARQTSATEFPSELDDRHV
jgi:hypothetical protein